MYVGVAWVLVSSGTQVQPEIILDPDYILKYLSVSYDYGTNYRAPDTCKKLIWILSKV